MENQPNFKGIKDQKEKRVAISFRLSLASSILRHCSLSLAVAFSPDDKRLLTGGRDKPLIGEFLQEIFGDSKFNPGVSARLWDVETGTLLQTFTKHGNDVQDVAYSHDGRWISTASADKTVEVWKLNK